MQQLGEHAGRRFVPTSIAGGGDNESSGLIAAYDIPTGKFDGLLQDANGNANCATSRSWAEATEIERSQPYTSRDVQP
jgi:hypothetical protein